MHVCMHVFMYICTVYVVRSDTSVVMKYGVVYARHLSRYARGGCVELATDKYYILYV